MHWGSEVAKLISAEIGKTVIVYNISSVGGGSINAAFRLNTNAGSFFVKVNSASLYPEMFYKEMLGLKILAESKAVSVPKPLGFGESQSSSFLVMPFVESAQQQPDFWRRFGEQLASLHAHSSSFFGLDHDNYIGSLQQMNKTHQRWSDFFREERLLPQLKLARDSGKADRALSQAFDRFFAHLHDLFPTEPPGLLHGDLWSGNYMTGSNGEPVIIDPAVYYGHREMDLAMTQLFGGFPPTFYQAYQSSFPLEIGWEKRRHYCNLYPLMVHVNLFGGGYLAEVKSVLTEF